MIEQARRLSLHAEATCRYAEIVCDEADELMLTIHLTRYRMRLRRDNWLKGRETLSPTQSSFGRTR